MAPVRCWTGAEARTLRQAMRLSVREFAEHIGVDRRAVNKWEARGSSITLLPTNQGLLDSALRLAGEEVRARFEDCLQLEDNTGSEEDSTNRRDATKLIGVTLATVTQSASEAVDRLASGRSRGQRQQSVDRKLVLGHEDVAQSLASLYRSADPRAALPVAVAYADDVLTLLDASMSEKDRTKLSGIVAGIHAQIGLWACHLHRPLGVRVGFDPEWSHLSCVRALDEQLLQPLS